MHIETTDRDYYDQWEVNDPVSIRWIVPKPSAIELAWDLRDAKTQATPQSYRGPLGT